MPKTPEQWLEETAPTRKRGLFKLFLGYAPGVGKTYAMLSEGIRRYSRGENVVAGIIETHGRAAKAAPVTRRCSAYRPASSLHLPVPSR